MESVNQQTIPATDAAEILFDYINTFATTELYEKYIIFYEAFSEWNNLKEKRISNAKQSLPKLIEDYFAVKMETNSPLNVHD